jgi:hypothetical protein
MPVTPLQEYSPLQIREPDPVSHRSSSRSNTGDVVEHPSRTKISSAVIVNGLALSKLKLPEFCIEEQVDMRGSATIMVLLG